VSMLRWVDDADDDGYTARALTADQRNPTLRHTCGPKVCGPGCPVYETEPDEVRASLDRTRASSARHEAAVIGDGPSVAEILGRR